MFSSFGAFRSKQIFHPKKLIAMRSKITFIILAPIYWLTFVYQLKTSEI